MVALVEARRAHRQLVDEDPPEAALGVEAEARIALGAAQLAMQGTLGQLEYPEVVVAGVVETVGRIAALEDEAAWLAVQFAAVLLEMHLGAARHRDQVAGFAVVADLGLAARVAELARAQARQGQGSAVGFPDLQAAAETGVGREFQRQREIGAADRLGPARLAFTVGPIAGGELLCHGRPSYVFYCEDGADQ
ncbi:hypothetical protein FQZ97_868270 [compost metagenome]